MNDINRVLEQFHNGNLEEASLLAENLLRQKLSNQEHVGLLNVLGSIHAINKKFEKARENFQAALDIDDGNIDTNYNLAKVLTNMNNNSLALKYYEKILKLRNDHAPSFNNMGDIYLSLKNYEKAISEHSELKILDAEFGIFNNGQISDIDRVENEQEKTAFKKSICAGAIIKPTAHVKITKDITRGFIRLKKAFA